MMKKSFPIRTRFAKDIVAEVMLPKCQPASLKRKRGERGKVAIFCMGLPSSISKNRLLRFLADQGYVAIFPRYRGTWESEGNFLEQSPADDIRDIVRDLAKRKLITNLFTGENIRVRVSAIHLFGSSFGGPAALLNSHLPIVKKVIAISPVIDWHSEGPDEPFDVFVRFTKEGFGGAYRTRRHKDDWQKLLTTDFYNPLAHTKRINGKKIFIVHAKDDRVVPYEPLVLFATETGAAYYLKPHGGHRLDMTHRFLWKKITTFLKKRVR